MAPAPPSPATAPHFPSEATSLPQCVDTASGQQRWAAQQVVRCAQGVRGSPRRGQARGNPRSLELRGTAPPASGGGQAGTAEAWGCWAIFTPHQRNLPNPQRTQRRRKPREKGFSRASARPLQPAPPSMAFPPQVTFGWASLTCHPEGSSYC